MSHTPSPSSTLRRRALTLFGLAIVAGTLIAWSIARQKPNPPAENPPTVPVDNLLEQAKGAMDRNDPATATALLNQILDREPKHGLALLYRGQLEFQRGDVEHAIADWQMIPDEPADVGGTARYLEGNALLAQNRAREAEVRLLRAIELHPKYLPPRERLLRLYVAQLRTERVRDVLNGIAKVRPWQLAECALQALAGKPFQKAEAGIQQMRTFAGSDPHDWESRLAVCRYLLASNQLDAAIEESRRLLKQKPRNAAATGLLIDALVQAKQLPAAHKLIVRHPPAKESPISMWRAVARYAVDTRDWKRAAACYQRVTQLDPYDVPAWYSLGSSLARDGHAKEAAVILKKASQLDEVERKTQKVIQNLNRPPELLAVTAVEIAETLLAAEFTDDASAWFQQSLQLSQTARASAGYERCLAQLRTKQIPVAHNEVPKYPANSVLPPPPDSTIAISKIPAARDLGRIALSDLHQTAGVDFQYFNGKSGFKYILETVGGGVAVLDYDLDGRPDVYFPQGSSLPLPKSGKQLTDRLIRNNGDGTFSDVSNAAGIGDPNYSLGAAVGDFDQDGFPDVVVLNHGRNVMLRNNGDGTFADVSAEIGFRDAVVSSSAAFADFDGDGLLDLYVANYVAEPFRICRSRAGTIATCDPQNFSAEQDKLYRNRGDGTFEDVTESSGIVVPNGKGLGIVAADLDGDGKIDIYVANDGTPNFLFKNISKRQGEIRFEERGLLSGAAMNGQGRSEAGMGIACADFNGDGRLDLYVTNFFRETNTLYLNAGNMMFVDATDSSGLATTSRELLGFGTQAADLNLDGHPDLIVANGDIDDYRDQKRPWKMRPQCLANRERGRFTDVSRDVGSYFQGEYLGRGVARWDWNGDGLPEVVVVHYDRPAAILKNDSPNPGHGVVLRLHGVPSNRDAVGATVRISAGGQQQVHVVCGGDGFSSSNERCLFVGLGRSNQIDKLEIVWPSGRRDTWSHIPADGRYICIEGRQPMTIPLGRKRG